jgi:CRISPR-associated endonuclease/helicase Cas3
MTLLANTNQQPLADHLFAVGFLAQQIHKKLIANKPIQSQAAFIAGCTHDLGKADTHFQNWVNNPKSQPTDDGVHIDSKSFSFEKYPRHNEISTLVYQILENNQNKSINQSTKSYIKHTIFWHHAKPIRDFEVKTYNHVLNLLEKHTNVNDLLDTTLDLIRDIQSLEQNYQNTNLLNNLFVKQDIDLEDRNLPKFKDYDNIKDYQSQIASNADKSILRATIITADHLVSKLSKQELHTHITNKTLDTLLDYLDKTTDLNIQDYLDQFPNSERTKTQSDIANQLKTKTVLAGPAGCGKTKISLEWARTTNAKQIIWICPRVQVAQGIFNDLQNLNTSIEVFTGEFQYSNGQSNPFQSNIIITTIDQIFNTIITHSNATNLITFLNAHVVFDEFHEYINMPAFNLLFAELVQCKKLQEKPNYLLVSATPHYTYLKDILDFDKPQVVKMPSFNQSQYEIEFRVFSDNQPNHPLLEPQYQNTMVISNTAITAQQAFILNPEENNILYHSKFNKTDKLNLFNQVFDSFKESGTKQFAVLRSGPIVQASLNITTDYMVSEITTAENTLQRLGRLDRFGKNTLNRLTLAIPNSFNTNHSKTAKFLSNLYSLKSTINWCHFLKDNITHSFSLPEIYNLYEQFHENNQSIQHDLGLSLKASVYLIDNKVIDPVAFPKNKVSHKGTISANSLRGNTRHTQLALCDLTNNQVDYLDQYTTDITASVGTITGYDESNKDLLAHMQKKHFRIAGGKKLKDKQRLDLARKPEHPIFLSYTTNDLNLVEGESARHNHAIYYAVNQKQPIGAMSIQHIEEVIK